MCTMFKRVTSKIILRKNWFPNIIYVEDPAFLVCIMTTKAPNIKKLIFSKSLQWKLVGIYILKIILHFPNR